MSQYPPPYPQPSPQPPIDFSYFTPQADLLAPAKRAAILQGVVGALVVACGVCVGAVPWVININDLFAQSGMTMPELPPGQSLQSMARTVYGVIGVLVGLIGLALLVLSFFVRRGGRGPVVVSLILMCLVTLGVTLNLIGPILQLTANPQAAILGLLIVLVLLALLGLNIAWLLGALRNASQLDLARRQYAAQYSQYQHQQQAYGQPGGYPYPYAAQGYGYPPQQPMQPQQPAPGQYAPGAPDRSQPAAPPSSQPIWGDPNRPSPSDPGEPPPPAPPVG